MKTATIIPSANRGNLSITDYTKAFIGNQPCRSTKVTYAAEIKLFYEAVGKTVQEVTLHDLVGYKSLLEKQGRKPATIAKKLTVLRSLFTFLYEQGLIPTNPSAGLRLPRVCNETTRDVLSLAECNRLLSSVGTSSLIELRDRAILALLTINALRVCEISRANVSDLTFNEGCYVLRVHGKGGKEGETRVRPDVYAAICAYLEARGEVKTHEPLFLGATHRRGARMATRTIQHLVMKHLRNTGINRPNIVAHSLRHSSISALIDAGASLLSVKDFARHSSAAVSQRYIHQKDKMKNHAVMISPITLQTA